MSLLTTRQPCRLARRLGAAGYDAILLFGVCYAATIPVLALHGGQAIAPGNAWFSAYLLGIIYLYFVWQWQRGGQTLGMKAWRMRLCDPRGERVGWGRASMRFFAAAVSWGCAGLGFIWCLFNREGLGWHDYWSGTRLFLLVPATASGNPAQQDESGDDHQQRRRDHADDGV